MKRIFSRIKYFFKYYVDFDIVLHFLVLITTVILCTLIFIDLFSEIRYNYASTLEVNGIVYHDVDYRVFQEDNEISIKCSDNEEVVVVYDYYRIVEE